MKRVHSGVPGLDRLLEGGFPENSCTLVTGPEGTGKTILAMQFLYEGCMKLNEPGIFIQTEDYNQSVYWHEETFNWDISEAQKKGRLSIYAFKPKDYDKFAPTKLHGEMLGKLKNVIAPMGIKRIVIDSITPLRNVMSAEEYHRSIYETIEFLKDNNITSLLVATDAGVEKHLCDGVINLRQGEEGIDLALTKMQATNFPRAWYPVTISNRIGFSVRPFL
ncbi:MAG: hypothetical protein JW834_00085 [Candidatus Diapherotrites archaeon]|nr:hypothetical protein [Candidatus Diapherotrites archaeon]